MGQCRRWQRNRLFQISGTHGNLETCSLCIPFSRLVPRTYWRHPPRPSALFRAGTVYCPNSSCRDNRDSIPQTSLLVNDTRKRPTRIQQKSSYSYIDYRGSNHHPKWIIPIFAFHLFPLLTPQSAISSERSTISHLSRSILIVRSRDSHCLVRRSPGHALVAASFESGSTNGQALYR